MQKIDVITNAILIKCQKRFLKSEFTNQHELGKPFNDTDYTFEGLFRSYKEWVIQKNGEYYTVPMSTQSISSNGSNPSAEKKKINIELIQIDDLNYDEAMFVPMKTGHPIDYMFSSEGGIYPATNYLIVGDPGIGKSTQTLDLLAKIKENDPNRKILFISGEMNQIDMFGYVKRYPSFGKIPTLFLCDYLDENPKDVIEQTYDQGWDIILIDSFIEVQEAIQSTSGMTRTQAEKWMIDLFIKHNKGNNDEDKYTSFLAIQQVTKGGNFVGSNKLKHNTTGMIELRYSAEFTGDRYAKVTKNRRGFKYEKIYFSLDKQDTVEYDQKRLDRDEEIKQRLEKEKELLLNEEEKFNQIFGLTPQLENELIEE
jgi:predicted ATP-dependent serine protease